MTSKRQKQQEFVSSLYYIYFESSRNGETGDDPGQIRLLDLNRCRGALARLVCETTAGDAGVGWIFPLNRELGEVVWPGRSALPKLERQGY